MYFLCDRKYQRTGQSCTAFGASFVQESLCDIFQSVRTSPLAACRNAWGGKNSLRSNIMPPVSKHCSATRCASQCCPLDKLLMLAAKSQTSLDFARLHVTFRLWRGITFCNKNSLVCITDFNAYNGNIKEKPAVSKSQRKTLLFGGHCARYVQTQYGNYISLKLPYAVRSAAPDKQQKGLKWHHCGRAMFATTGALAPQRSVL